MCWNSLEGQGQGSSSVMSELFSARSVTQWGPQNLVFSFLRGSEHAMHVLTPSGAVGGVGVAGGRTPSSAAAASPMSKLNSMAKEELAAKRRQWRSKRGGGGAAGGAIKTT